MGDSSINNKFQHQRQQSNRLSIPFVHSDLGLPINTRMVEVKMILSTLNFMGFSLYGYLLWINVDNVKGWILMIIGSLFGVAKLFFYIKRQYQAIAKEQQEQQLRDLAIKDKMLEQKDKELEKLERELSLRVTGLTPEQRKNRDKN